MLRRGPFIEALRHLALVPKVGGYFLMITMLDYAPNFIRRRILKV